MRHCVLPVLCGECVDCWRDEDTQPPLTSEVVGSTISLIPCQTHLRIPLFPSLYVILTYSSLHPCTLFPSSSPPLLLSLHLHPFCSLFIPTPFALSSSPPFLLSLHPRPLCSFLRMSAADLAGLVSRLETVTTRLEAVAARGGGGGAGVCGRGGKGEGDHVCEGRDVREAVRGRHGV